MRRLRTACTTLAIPLAAALALGACGTDDGSAEATTDAGAGGDVRIAVTTTVLGDVVTELVGDLGEVVVLMPPGANPHDFQASARQASDLASADAIVVNGGGFEEGLETVVDGAEGDGVPVLDAVEMLADGADEDRAGKEADHDDEGAHAEEDGHAHDGDAHFFTDPLAVAEVVEALAGALPEAVPAIDAAALRDRADALVTDLEALHDELEATLAAVPDDRRVLVTDHDVLASFADRYGFEIVATVIPTGSTSDGVSGGALAELAGLLRETGVPAVFTEQTASAALADTLASEVGDVDVVAIYAESLGPAGSEAATYPAMMRLNAQRIADALGD